MTTILGIETSCDETAAAIVRAEFKAIHEPAGESAMSLRSNASCESQQTFTEANKLILANIISSHIEEQQPYGGVVPEISSRAHLNRIESVIAEAFKTSDMKPENIDAIAVTAGPGLIGGVIVGVMTAKAMASVLKKPLIAVNHLEGHALTARLTENTPYPYLLLLMSGGHCQFLIVHDLGKYTLLGETLDDALGECFDKVAKLLGLGYPGGPLVEKLAQQGTIHPTLFPIPMLKHEGCDMSFSGLKTAVRQQVMNPDIAHTFSPNDICASFQWTATEAVAAKLGRAIGLFQTQYPNAKHVVLAGGVAANHYIRHTLGGVCAAHGLTLDIPPPALCTDNAVMIAWAGIERFERGLVSDNDFEPRARWPLG
jgi:N6-L-threonylcarbamoyladenine synthase